MLGGEEKEQEATDDFSIFRVFYIPTRYLDDNLEEHLVESMMGREHLKDWVIEG